MAPRPRGAQAAGASGVGRGGGGAPSARLTRLRDWTEETWSPVNTLEGSHGDGTAYFKICLLCYGASASILNKVLQIAARWFGAQPGLLGQGDPPPRSLQPVSTPR